jgi:hypothetical protein
MQLRVCRVKKAIRNNLNRWADSDEAPGMFAAHVAGTYRKVKARGKEMYLRLGETTQQEYKGKSFCTRNIVIAVHVDINGHPIGETMHFSPDGFLCSNVYLLLDDIAGAGIAGAGRCSIFLTTWCDVRRA